MTQSSWSGAAAREPGFQSTQSPGEQRLDIRFTGSGSEYFRIWIVNLLLTIVTLGIYSAWAKVRKLQYFYRNTSVAATVFNYHGRPGAILKGRLIALVLIGFYNIAFKFSIVLGLFAAALLAIALPWLILQSQRFRLHNSSYRGLRFRFLGGPRESYLLFGIPLLFAFALAVWFTLEMKHIQAHETPNMAPIGFGYLAFALAWPYLHFRLKCDQHRNTTYGPAQSLFTARARSFYKYYGVGGCIFLFIVAVSAAGMFLVGPAAANKSATAIVVVIFLVVAIYGGALAVAPYVQARLQNLVWNNTALGPIKFESDIRAGRLIFIVVTNLLLIAVTLGLFAPFAVVRSLKYKLESMTVAAAADLGDFAAGDGADVAATGEGAADLLDIDFSL